ncbi:MAG: fibronectin type III domain-containing protein, partial [Actinomycetota bacterium]
ITGYDIQYKLDTQGWEDAITATSLTTSASITGLDAGSGYAFRVRAVNGVGAGTYSTDASATPADIPATPANLTVDSFGDSEVALSWDAANDNGSAITRYEYRLDDGNGFGTAISAGTSTTATVTGLTNGTAYDFQIRAVNAIGDSAWSDSITETPRTTPATPTTVVVTGGAEQISVAWTDPADNGGSPITQYDVRYRIGTGDWIEVIDYTENDPITGLDAATTFEVEARAVNGVGNSAWSTSASGTTDA